MAYKLLILLFNIHMLAGCSSGPEINPHTGLPITKCHYHVKPIYVCEDARRNARIASVEPCGFQHRKHCPEGANDG